MLSVYNSLYDYHIIFPYQLGFGWGSFVLGSAKIYLIGRILKNKSVSFQKIFLSPSLILLLILSFILFTESSDSFTVKVVIGMAVSYMVGNTIYQILLNNGQNKIVEQYGEVHSEQFRYLS